MADIDYAKMLGEVFREGHSRDKLRTIFKEAYYRLGAIKYRMIFQVMSDILTENTPRANKVEKKKEAKVPPKRKRKKTSDELLSGRIKEKLKGKYNAGS